LYRIAQEALNNVVKHAQASQVAVSLRSGFNRSFSEAERWGTMNSNGEPVELVICDDGRGFDPEEIPSGRLGLGIIRERAQAIGATLEIDTELGCGTQIRVVCESQSDHQT
jgi:signal transduction histidine kinase